MDPHRRRPVRIEIRRVDPEAFERDGVLRDPPGAPRDRFLEQVVQQLEQALGGGQRRMLFKVPEPRAKVGVAPPAAARRSLPGRCGGGLRIVPVLLRRGLRPHRDRNLQIKLIVNRTETSPTPAVKRIGHPRPVTTTSSAE